MVRSGPSTGAVLLLLTLVPAFASADVPPPDVCDDVGSVCTVNGSLGVCEAATCSRIDYSSWGPESDGPPPMASYPCNRCVPSAGGALGTASGVGACCCVATLGLLCVGGAVAFARRKKKA